MKRRLSKTSALVEGLESRQLLSATVVGTPTISNVTKLVGAQSNPSIAINPNNPAELFVVSRNDLRSLYFAHSTDSGATWTGKAMFGLNTGFPQSTGVPSVAVDKFGNVFLAYRTLTQHNTEVLLSFDHGSTFHQIGNFRATNDDPQLAVGANSVIVAVNQAAGQGTGKLQDGGTIAYSADVFGLGRVKAFKGVGVASPQSVVSSAAIGPAGEQTVAYLYQVDSGPERVYTSTDVDGVGGKGFTQTSTQIVSQLGQGVPVLASALAGIDPSPSLAYDLSADAFTGRLYLAYVDAAAPTSSATQILLRISNDNGTTWGSPITVNDDSSTNTHFAPHVAVDPVTGAVAVTWYDARNDNGLKQTGGGTDGTSNNDVQVFGAVGIPVPGSVQFSSNFIVQPAFSNADQVVAAANGVGIAPPASVLELGTTTGSVFYNGQLYPAWADNSNSTGDNGDGTLAQPDINVGHVNVQVAGGATGTLSGAFGDSAGSLTFTTAGESRIRFQLTGGSGFLVKTGTTLSVHLSGTSSKSRFTMTPLGGGQQSLGNILINGSIGTINAPNINLTGTLSVQGSAGTVTMGKLLTGGAFAATGSIGRITVASMTNAKILAGANPGADGGFTGAGDTDDSFGAGSIKSVIVRGAMVGSIIGAGANPADGIFGNGNDQIVNSALSTIDSLLAGSVDSSSRIEAGRIKSARVPGKVNPASDSRFILGV